MLRRIGFAASVILLLVITGSAMAAGGSSCKGKRTCTTTTTDSIPPGVSISSPSVGATISGQVTVAGAAQDNVSVARVLVSVDGGSSQTANGTTSWSLGVDTAKLSDGSHTLTAVAVDGSGNMAATSESITVSNPQPPPQPPTDTTPPVVSISSPSSGATVSGQVTVSGSASDDASVASVAASVDGGAWQPLSGRSSWSMPLDTTTLADGSHTVSVQAKDAAGNTGSARVTISVQNTVSQQTSSDTHMVTPEGATIDIAPDVTGWTAQQVYDLLKPNAYQLSLIGPHLTVKVQTQYASSTSTSAGTSGGVYTNFQATIYLNATSSSTFPSKPDDVIAHEYGHAWTMYHLYVTHQGDWTPWLRERGLVGDPRVDSTYSWSKNEMIADDYRILFGDAAAVSEAGYINTQAPDPRTVAGFRDWFISTWA